jgi:hypothetical protein
MKIPQTTSQPKSFPHKGRREKVPLPTVGEGQGMRGEKAVFVSITLAMLSLLLPACGSLYVDVQVYNPRHMTITAPTAMPCSTVFFFGPFVGMCPSTDVASVDAAFQAFDGGYMVWEANSGSVYVLYNDGSAIVYFEAQVATFPETPITDLPPPAHFKPIRGFSRVWTHEPDVRERLGWPYAIEQAYTARVQGGQNAVFFDLPNSQIIQFEVSGEWHVVG